MTKGVTYERILNARDEPQNWLTYYGAYDGQRYSPLDQINKENVKRARARVGVPGRLGRACTPASRRTRSRPPRSSSTASCSSPAGTAGSGRSTRANGNDAVAVQARDPVRRVAVLRQRQPRASPSPRAWSSSITLNAHIIALDAETGKKVWDQTYGDVRAGESATVAPLIVKDMVIVGSSGGEFGNRGHSDAFKLETGERVWRTLHGPEAGRARLGDLARRRRGLAARRRELLGHHRRTTPT